jgi:signal transduction histidine kinase
MSIKSIRLRVLTFALASIVTVNAVVGVLLVFLFENQVLRYVEQDLQIHWTELATMFGIGPDGQLVLSHTPTDPRYHQPLGGAYWQVSEDGRPVLRSRSLWDRELSLDAAHPSEEAFEVEGPDGSELYIVAREVTVESASGLRTFSLAVALDHKHVVELRDAFGWDVARILVPIAVVLVLFAWLQIWLGLSPLRTVGSELNAVHAGRKRRMGQDVPDEIAPLVSSINGLLDRQENLVRKARDRAGALAHGLKTPLTILHGEVRRLEQKGFSSEAERLQEQLSAIGAHVEREVTRARTSGISVSCGAYTAVEETVARLIRLMHHMPRGDQLDWRTQIPADLGVDMDPQDFGEVVGNLLDNARKWAKANVTVCAEVVGDKARLTIKDDGPGFTSRTAGERPERGVAEQSDATSSGLGLGIVEDILAEYGATPQIEGNGRCSVSFEVAICRYMLTVSDQTEEIRERQAASPSRSRPAEATA